MPQPPQIDRMVDVSLLNLFNSIIFYLDTIWRNIMVIREETRIGPFGPSSRRQGLHVPPGLRSFACHALLFAFFILLIWSSTPDARAQISPSTSRAALNPGIAEIVDLRLGDHGDRTRLVVEISRPLDYHLFAVVTGGARLVLDLPRVGFTNFLGEREGLGLIGALRGGPRRDGGGRLVMDLEGPVSVGQAFYIPPRDDFSHRLVIDIVPATAAEFEALAHHTLGNPSITLGGNGIRTGTDIPLASQPVRLHIPNAEGEIPVLPPQIGSSDAGSGDRTIPVAPTPTVPSRPSNEGEFSATGSAAGPTLAPTAPLVIPPPPLRPAPALPVVDGLPTNHAPPTLPETGPTIVLVEGIGAMPTPPRRPDVDWPIVVIDPGHGGVDPGATAITGTFEKEITLDVSHRVAELLRRTGRIKVHMTREVDEFLPLRERVAIGRAAGGDLFVSIHADSISDPRIRGASVYTLSDVASDEEAAMLAQRENRVDEIAGIAIDADDDVMASILIDLAQRSTHIESNRFAELLVDVLGEEIPLITNAHREAGFAVLKAPDVPSALVELGYLSSADDAALLSNDRYQDLLAELLAAAILQYFEEDGRLQLASG